MEYSESFHPALLNKTTQVQKYQEPHPLNESLTTGDSYSLLETRDERGFKNRFEKYYQYY